MGRKKALLVGINKYKQSPLNGCVNDVVKINQVITQHFGFTDNKLKRMLTDQSATTANIIDRLKWLVDGAKPGDVLYFHYSGHGSQVVDTDYDLDVEPDGMDEIICPIDLDWRSKIVKDDDFARIFKSVPEGVNLTVALDCCHSGGGLRESYETPNRTRALQAPTDIMNRGFGRDLQPKARGIYTGNRDIHTIEDQKGALLSGCRSNQTSADAWIQKSRKYMGAFTNYMVETLEKHKWNITYEDLVVKTSKKLATSGYDQRPELNCPSIYKGRKFLAPFQ